MLTEDFNYNLPIELIAQMPVEPRDSCRFMVVDKDVQSIKHEYFHNIISFLQEGDLLVWNNSKVFKARLRGEVFLDESSDGIEGGSRFAIPLKGEEAERKILNMPRVEIFLVRPMENKFVWKVLAKPGKKLRLGMKVKFADDFVGEIMLKENDGTILMQFNEDDIAVRAKANKYGEVPTPPYVKNQESRIKNQEFKDSDYQTVYAKYEGSVAAPTAGFHFTPELIEKLEKKGVQFAEVTLHVGLGTFLPVKVEKVEEHRMHSEWIEITDKNAELINQAKAEGRRVVAVGTTTVRALEGVALHNNITKELGGIKNDKEDKMIKENNPLRSYVGDINIFIRPGFKFQVVDALITNFHLPKSTLLMLVSAFIGDRKFALECYQEAIENKYSFYSFGDAMLIK